MRFIISVFLIFSGMCTQALVVLQYHHVSDKTPVSKSISPQLFRAHLDYIQQAGFKVVDMRQLQSWLQERETLPDKTVVITFDGGYRSVYTAAYPELKRRSWPFTVFVNSKARDEKNPLYMSWDELRDVNRHGAVIGNHSDSHPHLIRRQKYESHQQWQQRREREIVFAEKRIRKEVGRSFKLFAYPFGEYDESLVNKIKLLGYLAFGQQSGPLTASSNPQALPRFSFAGAYGDMDEFVIKLNSLPFPQARIRVSGDDGKVLKDPVLPADISRPVLRIASPLMPYIDGAVCYVSGQGQIDAEIKGGVLVAKARRDLPAGRSRYDCKAHAGGGRHYWYSQLFIRRLADGSWVDE